MKTTKNITRLLAVVMIISAFVAPVSAGQSPALDAETIAIEAYIYLYPLVLMDTTRLQTTNVEKWDGKSPVVPMNTFAHFRAFPEVTFTAVVRPNFDTLYSILWMDITAEPMIISIPDSKERYYLMPAMDMWTDVFAAPGWRTTGTKAGKYAFCQPGWSGTLPRGVTRIDSPTPIIWFVGRTQTDGEKDFDAVHKFQDGFKITPLSQWGKNWKAPAGKVDPLVDMKTPPMMQVESMSGKEFFEYAARLMKLHRPHVTDFSQVARLAHIGIVPGKDLNFDKLDRSVQQAINKAPTAALKEMPEHLTKSGPLRNGWQVTTSTMGTYGNEYIQRGAVALIGLGAIEPADAIYPMLMADVKGKPLIGASQYVLHFDKDKLPPADAFWSVTLYNKDGFPVPNPMNRQNLSSWMDLQYNADGSLDLYLQSISPSKDKETNWLPTPKHGSWNLVMRLYAPRVEALEGVWSPPAIKKLR